MDRLAVLRGHLPPPAPLPAAPANAAAPLGPPLPVVGPPPFNTAALHRYLTTDNYDLRQRLLKFLEVQLEGGEGRGARVGVRAAPMPVRRPPRRGRAGARHFLRVSGAMSAACCGRTIGAGRRAAPPRLHTAGPPLRTRSLRRPRTARPCQSFGS